MTKSFLLYFDMMDGFDNLSDADAGQVMKAVFHYAAEGTMPEGLPPDARMFFTFARHWIDLDKEKYAKKCLARAEAGRKSALARQQRQNDSFHTGGFQTDSFTY